MEHTYSRSQWPPAMLQVLRVANCLRLDPLLPLIPEAWQQSGLTVSGKNGSGSAGQPGAHKTQCQFLGLPATYQSRQSRQSRTFTLT